MFYDAKPFGCRRVHLLVLEPGESHVFKLDCDSDAQFTVLTRNATPSATLVLEGALCQPDDFDGEVEADGFFELVEDIPRGENYIAPPGLSPVRYIRATLTADTLGKATVQVFE